MVIERSAGVTTKDIDEDIWCRVGNNDGDTPLHLAMRAGQVDVACMFIERSVDVVAQNNNRETLSHLASSSSYFTRTFQAKYVELAHIPAWCRFWCSRQHESNSKFHVKYKYGFCSYCQTIEQGSKGCGNCICTG
jgi:Ankyrin repeat